MYPHGGLVGLNIPKESLLRPEIGQADAREEVDYNEKFENGKVKILDRRSMQHGYLRFMSMMNVVLAPFDPCVFSNDVFLSYMHSCREWLIKKCSETKQTAIVLNFGTVQQGDLARQQLTSAFASIPSVSVVQPKFLQELDLTYSHVNTSTEWVLNECHFGVREFQEPFMKRLILLENVPACSEAELRAEFPEALNVLDFSFDNDCPGMVLIEVYDTDQGSDFIRKYMRHIIKGQRILVDWYTSREKRHAHLHKKYKERKARQVTMAIDDTQRMALVGRYHELKEFRDQTMLRSDLIGYDKLRECAKFKAESQNIQEQLYYDAKRRYQLNMGVPEPESMQIMVVRKLMSGEMERAKADNQVTTWLDLERQHKQRELELLRDNLTLEELTIVRSRAAAAKRAGALPMMASGMAPPMKRLRGGMPPPFMARRPVMMPPPPAYEARGKGGYPMPSRGGGGGGGGGWRGGRGGWSAGGGRGGHAVATSQASTDSSKIQPLMSKDLTAMSYETSDDAVMTSSVGGASGGGGRAIVGGSSVGASGDVESTAAAPADRASAGYGGFWSYGGTVDMSKAYAEQQQQWQ